ncbi:DUF1540 domain-containing protein [Ornithinimicrobium pratense]|uniref:DUF1540 domain-containing protein n=1 Tax=Ornithinimicrobium pratense TaxID=2593973 RepID=A0A5J6V1F3_9MICO|nr:DUF1540 domain-containing protein [Ornithinimicrobium pratense]QFG67589.1 DUF1540 domain-containing protein [Ornithinimicrobium pratense]
MTALATVADCTVTQCSFNHDGSADAITVGANGSEAPCTTLISLDERGGLPTASAHVGACQRIDCTHNEHLMCAAPSVMIGSGPDTADCLTFQPA